MSKNMIRLILSVLLASTIFSGCGIKTSEYSASADNVTKLRVLKDKDIQIGVSPFTAINPGEKSILCRLADTVETPDNESFEKYIENAFVEELKMAGIYNQNANIKLTGKLTKIQASTVGSAYWLFEMLVSSSNGKSITVATKREYGAAILAFSACMNMGTSFGPSVKKLISDIINHPEFSELLK